MYKSSFNKTDIEKLTNMINDFKDFITYLDNHTKMSDEDRDFMYSLLSDSKALVDKNLKKENKPVKVNENLYQELKTLFIRNNCVGKYIRDEYNNIAGYYCYYNFGTPEEPKVKIGWSLIHNDDKSVMSKKISFYIAMIRMFYGELNIKKTKTIEKLINTKISTNLKEWIMEDILVDVVDDVTYNLENSF